MFLCFSSGDRYTVAKSCLYHLKNYGIPVWYDYHELILGDKKREKNFEYAIKQNKYFIIIYSDNLFNSPCAVTEEENIFKQILDREIVIFPLLYKIKFYNLPVACQNKLENIIYNEVDDKTGTLSAINQIVTKILIDKLNLSSFDITPSLDFYDTSFINDSFLQTILYNYNNISKDNFNARISILFCIYQYIKNSYNILPSLNYISKILEYLFKFTNLNVAYNHKELIIAELSIIILFETIFVKPHL